jgi:hypothetical protein
MSPAIQIAILCGLALVLVALGIWIVVRVVQASPEKKELKRRQWVNLNGRLGDALVTEATDTTLYYAYSIHGVRYTTSQDVSTLKELLPADPGRLVGIANLKYAVRNPANSILLCEDWSGLRVHGTGPVPAATSLQSQTASDA